MQNDIFVTTANDIGSDADKVMSSVQNGPYFMDRVPIGRVIQWFGSNYMKNGNSVSILNYSNK